MNEEVKGQLRELSYQMMINEVYKQQIENSYAFNSKQGFKYTSYSTQEQTNAALLEADKKGFALSLTYNELLFENGQRHNKFGDGPDAVNIWAENYLNKFKLRYPISWYTKSEDRDGLHFGYYNYDTIEDLHNKFLREVEEKDLTEFEKQRVLGIATYYKEHRKLITKYFGDEVKEVISDIAQREAVTEDNYIDNFIENFIR